MPRYKFAWTNLPGALLMGLVRDLGLDRADPAESLRTAYGARPDEDFVRDAWPVLLDRWLARNSAARAAVVDGLWGSRPRRRRLPHQPAEPA